MIDPIALARKLIDIPSTTGDEGAMGEFLEREIGRLGFSTRRHWVTDTRFNIFADAGGQYIAVQHTFTTIANSSGEVVVQFVSGVDNPIVNGIVVR